MATTTVVHCSFDSGETDRTFDFNSRSKGVKVVRLLGYSCTDPAGPALECFVEMPGMSMAITSENFVGYPIPIVRGDATTASKMFQPGTGWVLAIPMRGAITNLRIKLRNKDGSAYVHTGFTLWLELTLEAPHAPNSKTDPQWTDPKGQGMDGAGRSLYAWDYVPTLEELANGTSF